MPARRPRQGRPPLALLAAVGLLCVGDATRGPLAPPRAANAAVAAPLAATAASARALQPEHIRYPSYGEIVARMHALRARAPQLVELWSAQEALGVPSPVGRCPGNEACLHWFLTVTNRSAGQDDGSLAERPQVFLSGNLHGNEEVGPVTLITLAELLVDAALAAAAPGAGAGAHERWLARLVDTRVLVIVPVTNPLGYTQEVREEDGVDPNRDFPYGGPDDPDIPATGCMATATARAVNEVWRSHLIQLAVTFHGGMEAIAYEWGSWNHLGHGSVSPDDAAQAQLADVMAGTAGSLFGHHYPVGRMNPLVYPVHGGMEDWAYAGSWDDRRAVAPCSPPASRPLGAYPAEKTRYNDAQLRAVNVLVETWSDKKPLESQLGGGSGAAMLTVEGPGDGHVPRNLRLALTIIDLVQPYVQLTALRASHATATGDSGAVQVVSTGAAASSLPAFLSPGLCVPRFLAAEGGRGADVANCSRHAAAYSQWHVLESIARVLSGGDNASSAPLVLAEADAVQSFWAGWDVGGAISVDGTAMLVAAWDARVPPALFALGRPGGRTSAAAAAAPDIAGSVANFEADAAFVADLVGLHGLQQAEAVDFARRLFVLQLFAAGALPVEAPSISALALWPLPTEQHQSGGTRWSFGAAAALVGEGGLAAPSRAPVLPRAPLEAAAAVAEPPSAVQGAPDLAHYPYETRFSSCFCLRATGLAAAADGLSAGTLQPCAPGADVKPPATQVSGGTGTGTGTTLGHRQSVDDASGFASTLPLPAAAQVAQFPSTHLAVGGDNNGASVQAAVRTFVALPFAVVDRSFARQATEPEPAQTRPQTHWVNARTDPAWRKSNSGFSVRGRHHAAATPLFLAVETRLRLDSAPVASTAATAPPVPSSSAPSGGAASETPVPAALSPGPSTSPSSSPSPSGVSLSAQPTANTDRAGSGSTRPIVGLGLDAPSAAVAAFFLAATCAAALGGLVLAALSARSGAARAGATNRLARWSPVPAAAASTSTGPLRSSVVRTSAVATTEDDEEDGGEGERTRFV